jgi:hypothetical protein
VSRLTCPWLFHSATAHSNLPSPSKILYWDVLYWGYSLHLTHFTNLPDSSPPIFH